MGRRMVIVPMLANYGQSVKYHFARIASSQFARVAVYPQFL
jgi:hypothetical protein